MPKLPLYLFENNGNFRERLFNHISSGMGIVLCLDYDGTLVPIKKAPSLAVLPRTTRELLERLIRKRNVKVVLVSGRSYSDLKNLVQIQNVIFISNHGFQINRKKDEWIHPGLKKTFPLIKKVSVILKEKLKIIPGAFVEDKNLTLTIHFRNVGADLIPTVNSIVKNILQKYPNYFKTTSGKKIIEVRPNIKWDKGKALLKFLRVIRYQNKNNIIVYIGDDKTDEDVFRIIPNHAVTIRVGKSIKTEADYYVKNQREVLIFLNKIDSIKEVRSY